MRVGRVLYKETTSYAVIENNIARLISEPYGRIQLGGNVRLDECRLLAPCLPSKIVAVGLNYNDHIEEMKHEHVPEDPVLFIKPSTCVIGPDDTIMRPTQSERVDYEAELALVIKKPCRDITATEASDYILGYTILNDVTARDLQKKDGQWTRGKGFDTFAPMGPWIDTEFNPSRPNRIQSYLNGQLMQDSTTDRMIHNPAALLAYISRCMTLLPGDVVTTGTPSGVGPMQAGDTIEIRIQGIGSLTNTVADQA